MVLGLVSWLVLICMLFELIVVIFMIVVGMIVCIVFLFSCVLSVLVFEIWNCELLWNLILNLKFLLKLLLFLMNGIVRVVMMRRIVMLN